MNGETGSNEALLRQQAERESNARTYPRHLRLALDRARGTVVEDVDGNAYYDCLAGAGSLALGHNHPEVCEAVERVLDREGPMHTLDVTTPEKEAFVDRLFESLPDEFAERARIQFCGPAGTDAVEAALKLVKTATGNRSVLAYRGAYHGMTHGSLSLTGDTEPKEPIPGLMADVHHLPYPRERRCPFGIGGTESERVGARYVERLLDDPGSGIVDPAGMILEPVQGEGGVVPAPDEWLREVRRITRERDVPLIVDEIQTGLGRTGEPWGFERSGITPDVLTLSKAIGGGLPLAVVVYDEALDVWEPGAHAGTFRGNQLAMAAGRATIEHVLEGDLDEHAAEMGERLRAGLERTGGGSDAIGAVRGRGLMLGVEVVDPTAETDALGCHPVDPGAAKRIQRECLDRGLIVERGGRRGETVRFLPPLTVSREEVDEIAGIFEEATLAAENETAEVAR
ncbi:diaminobutyrate--2-oxoglutarate transaminase [Halalkalicoccus sp. NIPERK01]|uniref:diaminobutyrate--2-oxoglutarate transaminase n=1 Tax=Halalkalicoccus sp. NIPERK01 TaxID=3053469 RepID=UPI00256EB581|nr:diaminobutyrate--2-oxoglutarate transaminase [Halalkalicoccus sp. NIPERK01]MDL5363068.1 diaminobutyrate--2-oxoglutarate transaminase [Halalkalicoccus sp. NIPERK01]